MPTKKRRVGFIPRNDVLGIINQLSHENNLSYSKIVNILVEEALYKRGLFNKENILVSEERNSIILKDQKEEKIKNNYKKFNNNLKHGLFNKKNSNIDASDNLDDEIYSKFLMFLQFQEKMKEKNT